MRQTTSRSSSNKTTHPQDSRPYTHKNKHNRFIQARRACLMYLGAAGAFAGLPGKTLLYEACDLATRENSVFSVRKTSWCSSEERHGLGNFGQKPRCLYTVCICCGWCLIFCLYSVQLGRGYQRPFSASISPCMYGNCTLDCYVDNLYRKNAQFLQISRIDSFMRFQTLATRSKHLFG